MPRIFSFDEMSDEQVEEMDARGDDMDFDPYAAPPSTFQYLKPPDFGGPPPPVRVAVRSDQVGKIRNEPSFIDKLLKREGLDRREQWEERAEKTPASLTEALAKLGVVRVYCRYDGGNDEGFAWFDTAVLKDGSTCAAAEILSALKNAGAFAAVGVQSHLEYALDDCIAGYWAAKLLGQGFGTGEYTMYGAFWADLETGVLTDDENAAPIVRNITLKPE